MEKRPFEAGKGTSFAAYIYIQKRSIVICRHPETRLRSGARNAGADHLRGRFTCLYYTKIQFTLQHIPQIKFTFRVFAKDSAQGLHSSFRAAHFLALFFLSFPLTYLFLLSFSLPHGMVASVPLSPAYPFIPYPFLLFARFGMLDLPEDSYCTAIDKSLHEICVHLA